MSSRKPKKGQKLGSSRRFKNRNRDTEEKETDDGFPDPGNEEHDTVSENQASNESSVLHSNQPVIACTNPNTSVFEVTPQPQSQDFIDLLAQAEVTTKKRKMGSTRKSNRNFKFEGIYEDEQEHRVQLSEGAIDEQGVTVEALIKEDGGKENQTILLDCAPSQSSEHESSIVHKKHLDLGTIMHEEDDHKNVKHQHLEAVLQSKPMDISSSELNQSKEAEFSQDLIRTALDFSIVTPTKCNVPLQELDESLQVYHQMDTSSEPAASLPNTTGHKSMVDTTYSPLNDNREERHLIHNDKPSMPEHTVHKTMDDQSSLNFSIRHKQEDKKEREDVDTLECCSAENTEQDEVTGLRSASLINEHEHGNQDGKLATVIWQNVSTKASTEDENIVDHLLEHKDDTLKLTKENIDKSESTEFREDLEEYKEVSVVGERIHNDSDEGVAATNLNQAMKPDRNIISPLKLKDQEVGTSSHQFLSSELKFQCDSEIKCYREEQNDLSEARCWTGESSADGEVGMCYDVEQKYRDIGAGREVENDDMQSTTSNPLLLSKVSSTNMLDFVTESELIPAETLYEETETSSQTHNLQHIELEMQSKEGTCSDQMLNKVIKDRSELLDIETEVIEEEKNDIKAEINAGSTEIFTKEDFIRVDDEKDGMSTFMNEYEMESVITNMQDYTFTDQVSMVVKEHGIESPDKGSASPVHASPTSDTMELIPETQVKLDMQVSNAIAVPGQKQSMSEECLVNPTNRESEAEQFESISPIVYIQESRLGQDDAVPENVRFSPSEKKQIDSTQMSFSGLISGGDQKDSYNAMKESIQVQRLEESTPISEDGTLNFTPETCYPQSSASLNIREHDAGIIDEHVIKSVVKNENTNTSQEKPQHISTEECTVLDRQDEETVMVKKICRGVDTTHVLLSDLVDTEVLKIESRTEVVESIAQNEEAIWEGGKNGQPISLEELHQNNYPDMKLGRSKLSEYTELVTVTINTDQLITSAEPMDAAEEAQVPVLNILQATTTPIQEEAHMMISTNSHRRKMGSMRRSLGRQREEKNKDEDMYEEEKEMAFTDRSTLLGPENGNSTEKNNDKREEINAGTTEKFTKEDSQSLKQPTHSELSSQTFLSSQTTIEHPSPATEHPDFKENDGNSLENVENRNAEIHTQTQTKKKKKFGSTRKPHGRHQPHTEGEEEEWKDPENTEEIEHQIITQTATSNLLSDPQNNISEVSLDIVASPMTTEQKEIIKSEVEIETVGIDTPPATLSTEAGQINTVVSDEVSNAEGLTDITEPHEKPGVNEEKDAESTLLNEQVMEPIITTIQDDAFIEQVSLTVKKHANECDSEFNVHSTCGPVELIPETQAMSDMQMNTENIHAVVSDQNISEEHLQKPTNRESEPEQCESTSPFVQTPESKSSQVDVIKENVEFRSSQKRRKMGSTRKSLRGQIPGSDLKNKYEALTQKENIQEQIADQKGTDIGVVAEENNDTNEEINAGPTENSMKEDIATVCSQQYVVCEVSSQTSDLGLPTIDHPSPATEHPDFKENDGNSMENVENRNAEIHTQTQTKKKKKFGSTRKPHGRHQPHTEGEEEEWKDPENTEEIEHQIITQTATSNLLTDPQNNISEVSLDIVASPMTTEQKEIIKSEVEIETVGINTPPATLSTEADQINTVVSDEVSNAEGLTDITEPHENVDVEDTEEIQFIDQAASSDLLTELQIAMNELSVDTLAPSLKSEQGMDPTHGSMTLIPETQARLDMPVVSEQYHMMSEEHLENPKNRESKPEQCENTCPVVHIQDLKLDPDDMATQNSGHSGNSGRRKKLGSTRRSLRVIKEIENRHEPTIEESTSTSENDLKHLIETSQSIQTHSEPLNIVEPGAEKMGTTCKNLEEGQSKLEELQKNKDLNPRYSGDIDSEYLKLVVKEDTVNPDSNFCVTETTVQEYEPQIHNKLDQSDGSLLSEIEFYLNKSFESTLNTTVLNPHISEFSEPMSKDSLQLPSSQDPQIHMEPSSPSRRRKMGSSRKISRNKHAENLSIEDRGSEQEKENFDKNDAKNSEPEREAKTVKEPVMAEGTEDMKESVELMSEVEAPSQINESSTIATGQPLPEGRRKFGSRRTAKGSSGLGAFTHGDYESSQKKTDVQVTKDDLWVSEPESTPISHPVSEPRPGTEEGRKTVVSDTNASTRAGLVSLDNIRQTSPCVVSTGGKQEIDFEQWNEQIPDFGEAVYNVVMVGNSSVGKTSFIKRLQTGQFTQDYSSTIGVDTFVEIVRFGSRTVKLYVWDTAGQERYHSITKQVFHKAQGLLLMYDITSSQSFHAVRAWISQVQEKANPDVILMLLANKNDCANREVQPQEGEDLSKEYNIHFMECSAATGENVSKSLKTLAWLLVKQRVRKEEEYTTLQAKPQNKKSGCC